MRFMVRGWFCLCLLLLSSMLVRADAAEAPDAASAATLKVANRTIIVLRNTFLGETPDARVRRAAVVINEVLDSTEDAVVAIEPIQTSYLVLVGGKRAFIVSPKDIGPDDDSARTAAEHAAANLRVVVMENHQARNPRFLLIAAGYALAATVIYALLLRGIAMLRRKLISLLPGLVRNHSVRIRVKGAAIFETSTVFPILKRLLWWFYWLLALLFTYEWLSFVLQQFPYTRPWGESLNGYLVHIATYLFNGIIDSIPGLAIALSIFLLAQGISSFSQNLMARLAASGHIGWLNSDTLSQTNRLLALAVWLFALAMAYPYLPGADTEAFKGLSVLIGLMVSLGASSMVGQAAAGLILTYTRTLRVGEYVKIGAEEGTVTEMGMFTTSVRTGLGEVLTIPNTMVTGSVTRNYSRVVAGTGCIVDTVVTIGYDTPWRQVEAMLIEAAGRTAGITQDPRPRVFQTALSDFYPEYRLVAYALSEQPTSRAELLTALHANIQDVFNEYGVQIMSPHYVFDPKDEKKVAPQDWYRPPARRD